MARAPKIFGGLAALIVIAGAVVALLRPAARTPEGAPLLTAIPGAGSFAPREVPATPVLAIASATDLVVDFGYKVASTSYSYTLALRFAADAEDGTATVTARHAGNTASAETPVQRLWDAPREAYAVALKVGFDMHPAAPALCLKAVVGPSKAGYDLARATLCVAQRDAAGTCHPETLACGQIRARS